MQTLQYIQSNKCKHSWHVLQIRLGTSEGKGRRQEYQLKVASLHEQLGDSSAAVHNFQQLLDGPLAYAEQAQRLHVECQLADVQVVLHVPLNSSLYAFTHELRSWVSQRSV